MKGKIIKSVAGFYDVYTEGGLYRCRAKGLFRALKQKPLVGDDVEFDITDTVSDPMEGHIRQLLPRTNDLIRPNVANVDQALLVFAINYPVPSYNMVDRFLLILGRKDLDAILCFNKKDLAREEEIRELRETYEACGCRVFFISAMEQDSLQDLEEALSGRTTVITGPSGAGKSTLINRLCPRANMETGELSRKIGRGKNTTRHVELLSAGEDTFLVDTPGFTSLYLQDLEAEDLKAYYPEFVSRQDQCRFQGCNHISEPGCAVKEALKAGEISGIRYRNYTELFKELKGQRPVYRKKDGRPSQR